jgi:hypothetical protein
MITRIFIAFVIFAGAAYYFNIDVRNLVDKSGVPAWLAAHGIATQSSTANISASDASTTPQ